MPLEDAPPRLLTTASQTVGPYLHIGMRWLVIDDLAPEGVAGERVSIEGSIVDGDAAPVTDALVEIWQADANGRYEHPADTQDKPRDPRFRGFGRIPTDANGRFVFATIRPGRVPGPEGRMQAPHLNVTLFMRGMLKHLITRVYFAGDPANAEDAVLQSIPADRRQTLIAKPSGRQPGTFEWNVVLQGAGETVFFEY